VVSRDDGRHFQAHTGAARDGFAALAEASPGELVLVGEAGVETLPLPERPARP
jgi:hypothetical protein